MYSSAQFGFGLSIHSDHPIPGALPATLSESAIPGIAILRTPPAATDRPPGFVLETEAVVYHHPSASFACRSDSIAITPAPGSDEADIGALLVANALPASLWMRGTYMLHAAAMRWPDHASAIALAGPSGIGKSTLAERCLDQGAELIADDSLALILEDGHVIASGLPGGTYQSRVDTPSRYFAPRLPSPSRGRARLKSVVILHRDHNKPGLSRLHSVDALEQLLQHRHRADVPALLGQQAGSLAIASRLIGQLAVFAWYQPHDTGRFNAEDLAILRNGLLGE